MGRSLFFPFAVVSDSASYLAGPHTTGAGVDVLRGSVHHNLDTANIRLECPVGTPVGVGHLYTEADALAADFAFCHTLHLLLQ